MRTDEQILHDRINLPRLIRRLEQSIQEDDWSKSDPPKRETWLKAQATLQQLRHAQLLLKNVELDHVDPTPAQERRYQHFETTLRHLEEYMHQVNQQLTPPVRRPKPLLPFIRPPPPKSSTPLKPEPASSPVEATLIPAEGGPSLSVSDVHNLLPSSSHIPPPSPSSSSPAPAPEPGPSHARSGPPTGPSLAGPSSTNITATPTILQNSRALQEQLSEQLALMATQLRRNATHFSMSLEKDKTVLEMMQTKVEGNFDFMKRERIRLRDFRGKSGGTTCLVVMSVVVVLLAFIIMVFVIRLT